MNTNTKKMNDKLNIQIKELTKKYNVDIDLNIFKNRSKKLNNYVVFTMNIHNLVKKNKKCLITGKKNILSKDIGLLWKNVKDEEKILYSKIAKRYNVTKDKKNKPKKKIKLKKKEDKKFFMFKFEKSNNKQSTTVLQDIKINGVTYIIDCFKNIIDITKGEEKGFINNAGVPVLYSKKKLEKMNKMINKNKNKKKKKRKKTNKDI